DTGRHGASVSKTPPGPRGRDLSERCREECPRAHARRADFPGTGDAARDRCRWIYTGRSRPLASLDGRMAAQGRSRKIRAAIDRWNGGAWIRGGIRAPDLSTDSRFRRIRVSGIAFGVVRTAGLHIIVAQALRARGVLRCAAQLATDGLLCAGAVGR